jgi:cytochrome d ubiquinol oxidase subunit I
LRRLPESRWFYRALVIAAPLSVVALIAGWVTTEVGRQPWVVYGVMPTADAVTGAGGIPVGYTVLALTYVLVGIGVVWTLRRLAARPLELDEAVR